MTVKASRYLTHVLCWADRGGSALGPLWRTADWGYLRFHEGDGDPWPRAAAKPPGPGRDGPRGVSQGRLEASGEASATARSV